jgi:2-polyprenyl-6-methoxyphenol hydroxylase-like FAD-dependent oxidoreductase
MTDYHVIIIGAGIGGLTAALSLQHHRMRVSIYEQAPELREFGAGLLAAPNAMTDLFAEIRSKADNGERRTVQVPQLDTAEQTG